MPDASGADWDKVLNRLRSPDPELRVFAATDLRMSGRPEAIPLLIGLLQDPSGKVRTISALHLSILNAKEAAPQVAELIAREPAPRLRGIAVFVLGNLGRPEDFETLISALQDPEPEVRDFACAALGRLGDSRAFEYLLGALKDPSGLVRGAACAALSILGDLAALEPLRAILEDSDDGVRLHALMALTQIGDEQARAALVQRYEAKDFPAPYHERIVGQVLGLLPPFGESDEEGDEGAESSTP